MAMTDSAHGFHYKLGVMLMVDMMGNKLRIKSLITGGQIVKEYNPAMQRLKHCPSKKESNKHLGVCEKHE